MPALADQATEAQQRRYADACASCHENNGFGVQVLAARLGSERATLRRNPPLPAAYIQRVVRQGLGAMPAMSRIEVSDAELASIIAELSQGTP
jgi:mono/diheme cytochrome c family protein